MGIETTLRRFAVSKVDRRYPRVARAS